MKPGTVAILVPVLDRPQNLAPFLAAVEANTPEPHRTVFVATHGDQAELNALEALLPTAPKGTRYLISAIEGYARKINLGLRATDDEFVFQGADDVSPHRGWLTYALEKMLDPTIGVVGTNDLCNRRVIAGMHATHSLIRRSYIDEHGLADGTRGVALFEGYHHVFVDDELVRTAMSRNAWAFAPGSIVEHLHPDVRKAPDDPTYQRGRARFDEDRAIFESRRHLWDANMPRSRPEVMRQRRIPGRVR